MSAFAARDASSFRQLDQPPACLRRSARTPPPKTRRRISWAAPPGSGGGEFNEIPGSTPTPVRQDPRHRYVPNNTSEQPTYRIGDVSNPNLKPWVDGRR